MYYVFPNKWPICAIKYTENHGVLRNILEKSCEHYRKKVQKSGQQQHKKVSLVDLHQQLSVTQDPEIKHVSDVKL